jgi:alkylation response protein AidB-like acyl-CoA dehydrogenase
MLTKVNPDAGYNDAVEGELLERARGMHPLLLRNASLHERERRLSAEVIDAMSDAGFWAMAAPRRWGGTGTSATTMARIGKELAKGCSSTAWVYNILHGTTWVASLGPDALQEAIFGANADTPRICGAVNPPGTAVATEGGYIVNGRWPYSSGSRHANWGQFGCNLLKPDGTVEPGGFMYLRMSDVTIEDTWFVAGMKGTGSETCVAKDAFVPTERFFHVAKLGVGKHGADKQHVGEPSDFWPFMPFLRATGHGILLGIAEAVLERVKAATGKPIIYTSYTHQRDSSVAQREIGEAAAKIRAAELLIESNTRLVDRAGLSRVPLTSEERARSKGEGAFTVDLLTSAVDKLMFIAGSGAFAESNDLQRMWRDLNVGARHTANLPYVGYEIFGRSQLGFETNISPPDFI